MSAGAWFRQAFDAPYLEVYAHRDAAEAERGTAALLQPLLAGARRVLDLACGEGRWARAVAARGPTVIGADLSWPLLAAAQRQPSPVVLVQGDMRHVPFRAASFDLVLSMFTSFGYFETEHDDRTVLAEVHRVLRAGGGFVLDVFNPASVSQTLVPETERQVGRWRVRERRHIDATRNVVVKTIELDDGASRRTYREEVRVWERRVLEAALAAAGFAVAATWGTYDGTPHTPASPRLIVLARRGNGTA